MATLDPLDQGYVEHRLAEEWLIGGDRSFAFDVFNQRLYELNQRIRESHLPTILLAEPDPVQFLVSFMAACVAKCPVFLGNPRWAEVEWHQVVERVQPDVIWASSELQRISSYDRYDRTERGRIDAGQIMIPTGGSSGQIRFAIHTWQTLIASARGFQDYFNSECVNACCVLPLYHVSGLMQFMRCFISGGTLAVSRFGDLETGNTLPFNPAEFFLSLVPTQLQRLLQNPHAASQLARFQTVLLGGAPAWADLLETARHYQIRLAPTYGMTETASQIATLKPEEFLAGYVSVGRILPHATVTIAPDCQNRESAMGQLSIYAKSLAFGYFGDRPFNGVFQPDDLGFIDDWGYLHIVGRSSDKIITGGENVFAAEVEAAIRATGFVRDVGVIGVGDRHWGEAVTAIYVPLGHTASSENLSRALMGQLTKFKHPKHWIRVDSLPRNEQGKLNRIALQQLAETLMKYSPTDS
ncbi:MAG TPA: 2-succinylbenzoate--CoA ligase, partial [Elainellaceae cyanobacterium]